MTTDELTGLEELLKKDTKIFKIFKILGITFDDKNIKDKFNISKKKESIKLLTKILNLENPNKNYIFLDGEYRLTPPESLKVQLFKELKNKTYSISFKINNIDYSDPFLIQDKLGNKEFLLINEKVMKYDIRIILKNYYNSSIISEPLIQIKNNKPYLIGHSGIKFNFNDKLIPTSDIIFYKEFVEDEVINQILENTKF